MSNTNLQPIDLFATPESVESLQDYISRFSGSDAIIANTIMCMTWNLCAKLTNEETEEA